MEKTYQILLTMGEEEGASKETIKEAIYLYLETLIRDDTLYFEQVETRYNDILELDWAMVISHSRNLKKYIHINQHIIKRNAKTGERNPVSQLKHTSPTTTDMML